MPMSPTKVSTPRLSDHARHVAVPSGIISTGWPRIKAQLAEMGVLYVWWQVAIARVALGKRADGKYASTIGGIVLSIPRQVGKTFLVGSLLVAMCLVFPGYTVLWTAHRTRTTTRTFQSLQRMVKRKSIAPHILHIRTANGEQEIGFRNGSVMLFGAREQGFGRGFDEVDAEVFDEAQILTDKALEDMVAATNQSRHPYGALLFFMGTPPRPSDPGEAFTFKRTKALSGKADDMFYVEMGADPDADLDDRIQWAKANWSFPDLTPLESMLRLRENLPDDDSWRREALGIWGEEDIGSAISPSDWASRIDAESVMVGAPVFAIDISPNQSSGAIAAAGYRADGVPHVEITTADDGKVVDHRDGADWIVPRLIDLDTRWDNLTVNIAAGSAAESLKPEIEALGIGVNLIPTGKVSAACGFIYNKATTGGIKHLGQSQLTTAVAAARKHQEDGEIAWKFGRRKSSGDITPLYAATLAVWALVDVDDDHGEVSVYGFNDLDACDGCGEKPHEDPDGDHNYLCIDCRDKEN
jgi:hypothetical protein